MLTEIEPGPNGYSVLIAAISALAPVITTIVSYKMLGRKADRIETKADTAAIKAADAVIKTEEGNNKIDEVHKTVNGRTDALLKENQELKVALAKAQTIIASRRSTD